MVGPERPERKPAGLLLAKWKLLGAALASKQVSAADCAVLYQLCERFNVEEGAAWPSLATLAADTGYDRRTVTRSIANLTDPQLGLVTIVQPGSRNASNRYRPALGTSSSLGTGLPLGTSSPKGRGKAVQKVGAEMPPESTNEPGYEAGVHGGRPGADAPAAGAGSPLGAAPAPADARRFPAFWSAFPKITGVFAAEQMLDELLADGVRLDDIVAGAIRYSRYVEAQRWSDKDRYTAGAVNWLKARRWMDDPAVRPPARAQQRRAASDRRHSPRGAGFNGKDFRS